MTIEEPPLTTFDILGEDNARLALDIALDHENSLPRLLFTGIFEKFEPSPEDIHTLVQIDENFLLLPPEYLRMALLRIMIVGMVITALHSFVFRLYKRHGDQEARKRGCAGKKSKREVEFEHLKGSHQMTNCIVNFCFTCLGMYYCKFVRPTGYELSERIVGLENLSIFHHFQIAYQLWAIYMGVFRLNDSLAMILHHFSVICVAISGSIFSVGFRYYFCFFFGVTELSSVPLAIMNMFKNHPEWREKMPTVNAIIKLIFSASFFTVRVFMWIPHLSSLYWHMFLLGCITESSLVIFFLILAGICASFLTFLQLFWTWKIINGLQKMAGRPERFYKKHIIYGTKMKKN